jgi:hypothetical protein
MVIRSETLFWVVAAVLFVLSVLAFGLGAVLGYAAVIRARGLGYTSSGLGVLAAIVVGMAGCAVLLWLVGAVDGPSPVGDIRPVLLGLVVATTGAAAGAVSWQIVRGLPARPSRRPGLRPRRHHYRGWSVLAAVLTVPAAVWAWDSGGLGQLFRVLTGGMILSLGLRRLERRFGSQAASIPDDSRGHVLYLRPFVTENRPAFRLPDAQAEFTGNGLRNWVALDEFLARAVEQRLGRFVALGNPAEALPPLGATRVYLSDDSWKEELERLAVGARAIVMEPTGSTRSLRWELECMVRHRLHPRLFIVTPARQRRWARGIGRFIEFLYGWRGVTWSSFAEELRAVTGWQVSGEDPGASAVVTFTDAGASTVVARGLSAPVQVVEVIAARTADWAA